MWNRSPFDGTRTYELGQLVSTGYQIFDDTWDTYIKEHKGTLCEKIIRRYYFNEICCDEPDRFRHYLNEHLERIMPYFNKLYESELIKINPLLNQKLETSGRSIENLIKMASSSDSEIAQILSNFAKSGNTSSNVTDKEGVTKGEIETSKRDYEENVSKTENEQTDVTRNRTENTDRTGSTESTLNETQTTNADKTKLYSDTPQRAITGEIDENYLTNYTHDTDNTTVTTNNTTKTDMTENSETTENETVDTNRDLAGKTTTDGEINDNRNKNSSSDRNQNTVTNTDNFEQSKDDRNESRGKQSETSERSTNDKGENTLVNGFSNITESELIMAFRKTFINVDEQIIDALSTNFMEVF